MQITWERTVAGYIAWLGAPATDGDIYHGLKKLAVLSTKQNKGLSRDGVVIYEPQPREEWGIHYTAPAMPAGLTAAILASLPTEP